MEELVIKGGGVLITAELGAYSVIEARGLSKKLKKVGGTSAGAILSTLIALGYSTSEIKYFIDNIGFKKFLDRFNPFRMFSDYGLFKGVYFLNWMEDKIKAKTGKSHATFADLHEAGFLDLHLFITEVDTHLGKYCSYATTPHIIVSEAVRASMSIPGIWKAFKFSNKAFNNNYFVDGGVINNYPINNFSPDAVGIFLWNKNQNKDRKIHRFRPFTFSIHVWAALMSAQDSKTLLDQRTMKRSIIIDSLGISSIDFFISKKKKEELYQSGITAATKFLDNYPC